MNKNKLIIVLLLSSNVFAQVNNESLGSFGPYWCDIEPDGIFGYECIGDAPGSSITSGDRNVFIGDNTGMSVSSGSYNTFVGESAGLNQTTAQDNTFIGHQAGFSVTTGTDNTFIGARAGFSNTSTDNTFIGTNAGYYNTSGSDNTFIGEEAGRFNTTGTDNVFIGEDAGYDNTTGNDNTAVGNQALKNNEIGRLNTAVGNEAGWDIGGGSLGGDLNAVRNTVVGNNAGTDIGAGVGNTCLGDNACPNTEHADFNTFIGLQAGFDNNRTNVDNVNNGQRNTGLGTYAGYTNREGTDNVWIGAFSDSGNRLPSYDHEAEVSLMRSGNAWDPGDAGSAAGADNTIFRTTVMGAFASAGENDSVAIGYNVRSDNVGSIAIGSSTTGTHTGSITIGFGSSSKANNTVVIGNDSTVGWTPNIDAITALGNSTYRFSDVLSNKLSVNALVATSAEIDLFADAGTADDDKWTLSAADGGDFSISTFATGVDVTVFSIANNGNAVIAGDLALNSDRRLKTNINSFTNALETVSKLEGKIYNWKDENRSPGEHIGFIAQEVEQVLPNLVSSDKTGIKSVNYQGVVPVLVNAINELNIQVKKQDQQSKKQDKIILQLQYLIEQQQTLIIKLSQ